MIFNSPARLSVALALSATVLAGCGAANRTDAVPLSKSSVAAAPGFKRAATCIQQNLFPERKVRVAADGQTFSFTRLDPSAGGISEATQSDVSKIEVSMFTNRGISDIDANVFTALSMGDENDAALVATGENCVFENMQGVVNFEMLKPLPAPAGYRSLPVLLQNKR